MQTYFPFPLQSSSLPVEGAHTEEASHSENTTRTDTQEGTIVGEGTAAGHARISVFPFILLNQKLNILFKKTITCALFSWPVFIFSDAMTDLDIQELANLTAGDADVDNFERLFTKLKEMKGKWKSKNTKFTPLHL